MPRLYTTLLLLALATPASASDVTVALDAGDSFVVDGMHPCLALSVAGVLF